MLWTLTCCLLMDGEFSNQKARMRCPHRGDRSSHSAPSDFPCFKISVIMADCLPLCCHRQGHQTPARALFCRVKRLRWSKPSTVNYEAICIVIHAALREETYAHVYFLWLLPQQLCIPSHPPKRFSFSSGRRQTWHDEAVLQYALLLAWYGTSSQGWRILSYSLILIITSVCNINLTVSSPVCDS